MWPIRKKHRDQLDLESQLRANRPDPSPDFVNSLSAEIREWHQPARRVRVSRPAFRLAPVMGMTVLLLIGVGAFGGAAIANGGDKHNGHDKHHDGKHHHGKPDDDEYKKRVMCHKPNGKHPQTIRVKKKSVAKHSAHGDTLGACPNGGGNDDDDDDD